MDFLYILMFIIPALAQLYVSSTYKKYIQVKSKCNLSGYDMAKKILERNGLGNLYIVETTGTMTDHYDPTRKVVRLSTDVFNETSVAAMAIAAHECGHAIQDKKGYLFLRIRHGLVPFVNLASKLGYIAILIGCLAQLIDLIWLGIIFELVILLFQI